MIFVKIYTPGVLSRLGHTFDPIPPSRVNIVDMRTFVFTVTQYFSVSKGIQWWY